MTGPNKCSEKWRSLGGKTVMTEEHYRLYEWALYQLKMGDSPARVINVLRESYPKVKREYI